MLKRNGDIKLFQVPDGGFSAGGPVTLTCLSHPFPGLVPCVMRECCVMSEKERKRKEKEKERKEER